MTTKEKAIMVIEGLPDDASLGDIVEELRHLEPDAVGEPSEEEEQPLPEEGVWDLLEHVAGTVEMQPTGPARTTTTCTVRRSAPAPPDPPSDSHQPAVPKSVPNPIESSRIVSKAKR